MSWKMRRERVLWLVSMAVTILTMAAIIGFSAQNAAESSALSGGITAKILPWVQSAFPDVTAGGLHHVLRKLAHFTVYFVLGCSLTCNFSVQDRVPSVLCAIAAGGLFAASDEFHQLFSEGRSGSVQDVILDTCGVAVGSIILWNLNGMLRKRKQRQMQTRGQRGRAA